MSVEKILEVCEEADLTDLTTGPLTPDKILREMRNLNFLLGRDPKKVVIVSEMIKPRTDRTEPVYQTSIYIPKEDMGKSKYPEKI